MPTFTCYLPDDLLRVLDESIAGDTRLPDGTRATRSSAIRAALERYLDTSPATVKDVFREALPKPERSFPGRESRADAFHRATQR